MHTDDHILTTFLAANRPLQAVAAELRMSVTDLIRWLDRNFELLAAATRAVETRLKFLSLNAEAAAINDLSSVSTSTNDEERKRKSSSQILRHVAKRLCPSRTPQPHEPPARPRRQKAIPRRAFRGQTPRAHDRSMTALLPLALCPDASCLDAFFVSPHNPSAN